MTVDETRLPGSYAEAEALHMRVVYQEASAYRVPGAAWEDVVQEGRIGLWKALHDYDPARGIPFYAFARLCISRQIITALKTATRVKHRALTDAVRMLQRDDGDDIDVVDTLPGAGRDDPGELASWRSTLQALAAWAGDALSPLERRSLAMRASGWSYDQIADYVGNATPKTVDNAIQRGERKIAAFMEAFDAGHIPDAHPASHRQEAPMSTQPPQQTSAEVQAVAAALEKLRRLHDVEAQLPERIAAAEAEYSTACEALPFRLPAITRRRTAAAPREQRAESGPSRTLMESPVTKGIMQNLPGKYPFSVETLGEKRTQGNEYSVLDERAKEPERQYDGLARCWFALAEEYGAFKAELHARVRPRGVGPLGDFCAVYRRAPLDFDVLKESGSAQRQLRVVYGGGDDAELSVFVDSVEIVDQPEGVCAPRIPTVVRLNRLDRCSCCGIDSRERAARFRVELMATDAGLAAALVLIGDHRELGRVDHSCWDRRAGVDGALVADHERERDLIKRSAEIVGGIARDEGPRGIERFLDLCARDVVAGLGVALSHNGVRASVHPSMKGLIEGVNVVIRPLHLAQVVGDHNLRGVVR